MDELRPAVDVSGEPVGFERRAVVGDEGDRAELTGVGVGEQIQEAAAE
jgi:hypothetical protein